MIAALTILLLSAALLAISVALMYCAALLRIFFGYPK